METSHWAAGWALSEYKSGLSAVMEAELAQQLKRAAELALALVLDC